MLAKANGIVYRSPSPMWDNPLTVLARPDDGSGRIIILRKDGSCTCCEYKLTGHCAHVEPLVRLFLTDGQDVLAQKVELPGRISALNEEASVYTDGNCWWTTRLPAGVGGD